MKKFALTLGVAGLLLTSSAVFAQTNQAESQTKPAYEKNMTDHSKMGMRKHPGMMFDRMDTNKDGKISRDEFQAFQQARQDNFFKRLDTNKDGYVSREEFMAGKMNDHHKMAE